MIKHLILVTSVALALSACSSNKNDSPSISIPNTGANNQSTNNSGVDTNNNPANKAINITYDVSDFERRKIAQVNDASGGVATGAKYTLSINGKQYQSGQTLNLSDHMTRNQVNDVEAVHTVTKNVNGSNYSATQRQNIRAYLQNYSWLPRNRY